MITPLSIIAGFLSYAFVVIFIFTLLQSINISDLIKYLTFTAYLKKNFLQNDFFPVEFLLLQS